MVRLTGHQDVSIMGNEILNDLFRAVYNVDITPVDPGMLGFQSCGEQIISCLSHLLPAWALGGETVSRLNIHVEVAAKIFFDDRDTVEGDLICSLLDPVEFGGEDGERVVDGVAYQEGEVDQVVGVCHFGEEVKVFDKVGRRVAKRSEHKHSFLIAECSGCGNDGVQVDAFDGAGIDLVWFVVVKEHRGLKVLVPCYHLVLG